MHIPIFQKRGESPINVKPVSPTNTTTACRERIHTHICRTPSPTFLETGLRFQAHCSCIPRSCTWGSSSVNILRVPQQQFMLFALFLMFFLSFWNIPVFHSSPPPNDDDLSLLKFSPFRWLAPFSVIPSLTLYLPWNDLCSSSWLLSCTYLSLQIFIHLQ